VTDTDAFFVDFREKLTEFSFCASSISDLSTPQHMTLRGCFARNLIIFVFCAEDPSIEEISSETLVHDVFRQGSTQVSYNSLLFRIFPLLLKDVICQSI
jgi:hypothetical protein